LQKAGGGKKSYNRKKEGGKNQKSCRFKDHLTAIYYIDPALKKDKKTAKEGGA